jgi:type 1 glutamine amidotransferase
MLVFAKRCCLLFLVLCIARHAFAADANPPIRALLVTGGGWHDFETQKKIIAEGVSDRIHVQWTLDYEAGKRNDFEPTRFQDEDWIEPFDVVLYSIGIGRMPVEKQKDLTDRIADAHRDAGVPAVFIHNALHFGREVERWAEFTGLKSRRHTSNRPREVRNLAPDHPIMRDFGETWAPATVELYLVESVSPGITSLADCDDEDGQSHIAYWTHHYGDVPVFGTTIGHDNRVVADPVFLNTMARGMLWATGKLDDDGNPLPAWNRSLSSR